MRRVLRISLTSGFLICSYIVYLFVDTGTIQSRHPLLSLGILLVIIGVQLVATGFLGEWFAYQYRDRDTQYRVRWSSDEADDAS